MKRQAVEGEGENSHANKGILSAPEAAWAATSIPPSSSLPSLPLSQWIYYPLPLSAGLLNGPQLLNFMPRVNLVTLMVAAELQWRGLALFFNLPLGLRKKPPKWIWESNVELASYEVDIQIGSTCTLKWAGATGSNLFSSKVYWRTGEGSKGMVDILLSEWNLNSLSN